MYISASSVCEAFSKLCAALGGATIMLPWGASIWPSRTVNLTVP